MKEYINFVMECSGRNTTGSGVKQRGDHRFQADSNQDLFHFFFKQTKCK